MSRFRRGEVWLVDLGMTAKVRPCLVISVSPTDEDRALVTPWLQDPMVSYVWENYRQGLVSAMVQLMVGSFLVFGRQGITRLWRVIHPMDSSSENSPEA